MSLPLRPASQNRPGKPAAPFNAMASASVVNRTHRVVRERARTIEARKKTFRGLWIPLTISGGLLLVLVCAIWSILDQYDLSPNGLPDANQQMLVLMMWCLPISVVLLAVLWIRRGSSNSFTADHENNAR